MVTKYSRSTVTTEAKEVGIDGFRPPIISNYGGLVELLSDRTGSNMPNWRKLIKTQTDATTGLDATYRTILSHTGGSATLTRKESKSAEFNPAGISVWNYSGNFVAPESINVIAPFLGEIDAQALTRFYQNLSAMNQSAAGGTILGELMKTLHEIRNPLGGLRRGMGKYLDAIDGIKKDARYGVEAAKRRGVWNRKQVNAINEAIRSTWLEFSFGWQPLINDVKDIAVAAGKITHEGARAQIVRGKNARDDDNQQTTSSVLFGNYGFALVNTRVKTRVSVRYRAALNHNLGYPAESLDRMVQIAGLGLDQFVPTIWELLPYSWLVDYFTNAGDVIAAACTDTRAIVWMVRTIRIETTKIVAARWDDTTARNVLGDNYLGGGGTFGTSVSQAKRVLRAKVIPEPVPLQFSLPGSPSKVMNMLAVFGRSTELEASFPPFPRPVPRHHKWSFNPHP